MRLNSGDNYYWKTLHNVLPDTIKPFRPKKKQEKTDFVWLFWFSKKFLWFFIIFKKSQVRWKSQHFKIWLQKSLIDNPNFTCSEPVAEQQYLLINPYNVKTMLDRERGISGRSHFFRLRLRSCSKFLNPVSSEISDFTPCTHAQSNILHTKYADKPDY